MLVEVGFQFGGGDGRVIRFHAYAVKQVFAFAHIARRAARSQHKEREEDRGDAGHIEYV